MIIPYNAFMFGKDPEQAAEAKSYGANGDSIRISAGLEKKEDILDTLKYALDKAIEVKKAGKKD